MDRLSWSRTGHIGYIARGRVYVTWLRCIDGASWALAPPLAAPPLLADPVHVEWASGTDLAVVDGQGRIQIYEVVVSGKVEPKSSILSPTDTRNRMIELDAVVSTYHLGSERALAIPSSVPELSNNSASGTAPVKPVWESIKPQGPSHPSPSTASLLAVTKNGLVRLIVELGDKSFREVSVALDDQNTVLQAAFVPSGKSLLLATYTAAGTIIAYKIDLEFSPGLASRSAQPASASPVTMACEPIASIGIEPPNGTWINVFKFVRVPIPQGASDTDAQASSLELHIVFSDESSSHIGQYRFVERPQSLHPNFRQLFGSTSESTGSEWRITAAPLEKAPSKIVAFTVRRTAALTHYADGSVTASNLLSAAVVLPGDILGPAVQDRKAISKADHIQVSPNFCVLVSLNKEDEPKISRDSEKDAGDEQGRADGKTEEPDVILPDLYQLKCIAETLDTPGAVALATAISTSYAFSVYNNLQSDDLMAVVWELVHEALAKLKINSTMFMNALTAETQRLLSVVFDPPADPVHVDRTSVIPSPLQRWLVFQLVMGTERGWKRRANGQMAWLALNTQLMVFGVTWTLKVVSQPSKAQNATQQINEISAHCYQITNILGLLRWLTDLTAYMSREVLLVNLTTDPNDVTKDPTGKVTVSPTARVLAENPSSLVNLFLSKILRFLLIHIMRGLRGLEQVTQRLAEREQSLTGRHGVADMTLRRYQNILSSAPVDLGMFRQILADVDKHMAGIYGNGNVQERTKQALEMELIKNSKTPQVLCPIVGYIGKIFQNNVLNAVDMPKLYFYDTSWLRVASPKITAGTGDIVDGIRKHIIRDSDHLRTCTRCGNISALENGSRGAVVQADWTMLFARTCLCGGLWEVSEFAKNASTTAKPRP